MRLGAEVLTILAVVVRYNTAIDESDTLRSLSKALTEDPDLTRAYKVLIWDNSPAALDLDKAEPPLQFEYHHSERNLGVSGAYNGALQYAMLHNCPWMLLLDQDSELGAEFLHTMLKHARELATRPEIVAIAPLVKVGNRVMSPREQLFLTSRGYPEHESGVASGEAIAINSGCLIRTSALQAIGGFSQDFWLDYSDMYVFHQFYRKGGKVWRATDAELQHEMTILDYDRLMSPWRYRNFSYAETAFYDLYKSRLQNLIYYVRLLVRAIRQRRRHQNPVFSQISWQQFIYRVTVRKQERLRRWRVESTRRAG